MVAPSYILNFHSVFSDDLIFHEDSIYGVHLEKLKQIVELVEQKNNNVLFTFDDGHLSDGALVLPYILEKKLKPTFFVLGKELVSNINKFDQTKLLASENFIIGSHGFEHVDLTRLPASDLKYQLFKSKEIIENCIQKTISEFSLPYGKYNQFVLDNLIESGFEKIYTTDSFCNLSNNTVLSRFNVKSNTSMILLKLYLNQDNKALQLGFNSIFGLKKYLKNLKWH